MDVYYIHCLLVGVTCIQCLRHAKQSGENEQPTYNYCTGTIFSFNNNFMMYA